MTALDAFALKRRALELAAFKPTDRTAQNAVPIVATADRSVNPHTTRNLEERPLTHYRSVQLQLAVFNPSGRARQTPNLLFQCSILMRRLLKSSLPRRKGR